MNMENFGPVAGGAAGADAGSSPTWPICSISPSSKLVELERMGEKSAENVVAGDRSRRATRRR